MTEKPEDPTFQMMRAVLKAGGSVTITLKAKDFVVDSDADDYLDGDADAELDSDADADAPNRGERDG